MRTVKVFTVSESSSWVKVSRQFLLSATLIVGADMIAITVNSESLEVSYLHLATSKPILAYFLANSPQPMLATFDEVALQAILLYYPNYERIHSEIHVRITELPTSLTLRDLRQGNLNCLVRISGVVTRRSGVFPQLKYVKFDCGKCGAVLGPFFQDTTKELKISFCQNCEGRGPFTVNSEQVRSAAFS